MAPSFEEQFAQIVRGIATYANAYLCDGDPRSAVAWDPENEITVRLQLRGDEVWVLAGSGTLIRTFADSTGELEHEGLDRVIRTILSGRAIEYFGVAGYPSIADFVTGHDLSPGIGFSGGLNAKQSQFSARIAGPLASAYLDIEFDDDDE